MTKSKRCVEIDPEAEKQLAITKHKAEIARLALELKAAQEEEKSFIKQEEELRFKRNAIFTKQISLVATIQALSKQLTQLTCDHPCMLSTKNNHNVCAVCGVDEDDILYKPLPVER